MEPLSVDMKKETVSQSVLNIASLHHIDVVLPDSAFKKEVAILVKKKNPLEILEAIATASGYKITEVGGIYVFSEVPPPCRCLPKIAEK